MTTEIRNLVILIPHQRPASIVNPELCEPADAEAGDKLVAGDHDCHGSCTVGDWLDHPHLHGHQRHAVDALVAELLTR